MAKKTLRLAARDIKLGDVIEHPLAGEMPVTQEAKYHEPGRAGEAGYYQIFYMDQLTRNETYAFFPDTDDPHRVIR